MVKQKSIPSCFIRVIRVIRGYASSMKHEELTGDIIGAAMAVLNELKPGLDEKLYENALVIELVARAHTVEQQREYPVHCRGHFIGKLVPDSTGFIRVIRVIRGQILRLPRGCLNPNAQNFYRVRLARWARSF
jgi:hypothetical protein